MADEQEDARPDTGETEQAELAAFMERVEQSGGIDGIETGGSAGPFGALADADDKGEAEGADDATGHDAQDVETPAGDAEDGAPEGDGEGEAAADVQGLDDALKAALKRDGLSDDLIDLLVREGRDQALEYALRRRENQREVSLAYQERAELKKQTETPTGNGEEAEESAHPETVNLDELVQPLTEELGEETAGAVVKLAQALVQPMQQELQALKDAQATSQQERIQEVVTAERRSLRERFPQLEDNATWQKVFERAQRLEPGYRDMEGGLRDRVGAVLLDAARLELGAEEASSADARNRRTGKSPTPPRRKTPSKKVSSEEQELEAWKARMKETGSINAFS